MTESFVSGSSARRLGSRTEGTLSLAMSRQGVHQEATIRQRQIDRALEQLAQAREDLARERAAFKAMREAAENLEFERAAQMRDEAERIRKMGLGMVDNALPVRE